MGHAFLRPSHAGVWVYCHGAPQLLATMPPEDDSPASLRGNAGHWGAKNLFYQHPIAVGQVADNGTTLDEEIIASAEKYVAVVQEDLRADPMQMMYCEQPINIPSIHAANWGTPDFWAARPGFIRLWDFKNGFDFVEVFENWQLLDYLAGILDFLNIDGLADQHTVVEMVIVQPNSFHPDGIARRWRCMASDLRGYFNTLKMAADDAMTPGAPVTTGEHCKHCPASGICRANQRAAMNCVDMSEASTPFQLDAVQTGIELRTVQRAIELLKSRERGLAAQSEGFLRGGHAVPFYEMGRGRSALVWKKTPAEIIILGQLVGVDLKKPDDVITPTQAKELPIDPAYLEALSERIPGAVKLTPIDPLKVRKAFK